jgi:hypothetical protein
VLCLLSRQREVVGGILDAGGLNLYRKKAQR